MHLRTWDLVDAYFEDVLGLADESLAAALAATAAAGMPAIAVSPAQGKLLHLLARCVGARRILEVGTLGGYSAIWLARALPEGGRLVTLEIDPRHAQVARANLERAGLASKAEVRVGPALEALPRLAGEGAGPFDLTFIDADKASNADYLGWAVELSRDGSLIVIDNVVRGGTVTDGDSADPNVRGVRRALERLASDPRLDATALQTVGVKGYDGFAVARVTLGR